MSAMSTGASEWECGAKPISVTIQRTRELTGLGSTTIYKLIGEGRLRTAKVCGRRLVIFASIEKLIDGAVK